MERLANPILAKTIVTPEFLNSIQEEIANVVEYSGITLNKKNTDSTWAQFLQVLQSYWSIRNEYDIVITNQTQFNALFTRTGANAYNINSQYRSVLLRNLPGGYLCYGNNSILQSVDTYAVISTNNCTHLIFENGAYLAIGTTPSYINVNTDNCRLDNVWVRGSGASGSSYYGFVLSANKVLYNNCKVSDILSTVSFIGFNCSGTALNNYTSKYVNCSVFNIVNNTATMDITGFYGCYNLSNCLVNSLNTSGGGRHSTGFDSCYNLANCFVYTLDVAGANYAFGFNNCNILSTCQVYDLDCTYGVASGFNLGNTMSSCYVSGVTSTSGAAIGFFSVGILSSCSADNINTAGGTNRGYYNCSYMASCYTTNIVNDGNNFVCSLDPQIVKQESCPELFT